jgi:hypothetical protein
MLLDIAAEMQKLVRDRAKLYAYAWTFGRLLELFHQAWMLHEREAMSDALCIKDYCIVKVGVFRFR